MKQDHRIDISLFYRKEVMIKLIIELKTNEIVLGLYYTWRTRIFRSLTSIVNPFFFDSTGSLYFNTTPPLLIVLATEQSFVATSNVGFQSNVRIKSRNKF